MCYVCVGVRVNMLSYIALFIVTTWPPIQLSTRIGLTICNCICNLYVYLYVCVCVWVYVHSMLNRLMLLSVHCIDVPLCPRYFQLILGRIILSRFQSKHLHLLLERQLLWHRISSPLLLLLLLLLSQTSLSWIPKYAAEICEYKLNP